MKIWIKKDEWLIQKIKFMLFTGKVDIYFWNINLNDLCINSFFNAESRGGKTHINSVVVEIELQDGPL